MTKQEKELIMALALKSITREDFLIRYPADISDKQEYILFELEKGYEKKEADDIEYSLLLGFSLDSFSENCVSVLNKLILERWHYKHEDIALLLQKFKKPSSIESLYLTALAQFDYLSYDESFSLARKCIHALGDINTEEAKEKLRLLAKSNIPIVREKAEKQLFSV